MGYCKKDVTPVCQQWSYAFFKLTHRNANKILYFLRRIQQGKSY